jgi:glycosyltransferase involved in cell wall biosynthesis
VKIIFDGRVIRNRDDGLGIYSYQLIKNLLNIDSKGSYRVIHRSDLKDDHRLFGLRGKNIRFVPSELSHLGIRQRLRIPSIVRKMGGDVYHYPHLDCPPVRGILVVSTIHDLKYVLYPSLFPRFGFAKKIVLQSMIRSTLRRSDRVITVSESTRNDLLRLFKVDPKRVIAIHSGNNIERDESTGVPEPFEHLRPYFLFVGGTRPHKNLEKTIDGFRKFVSKGYEYRLVVVGEAYLPYDPIVERIRRIGLEERVKVLEYVSPGNLKILYRNAVSLLFPSLYEGFGFPIIEAMAFGVPVITSNISSTLEIGGDSAFYIDPRDDDSIYQALMRLADDRDLYGELVSKGYERAARFSWEKTARKTLEVYTDLVARSG